MKEKWGLFTNPKKYHKMLVRGNSIDTVELTAKKDCRIFCLIEKDVTALFSVC